MSLTPEQPRGSSPGQQHTVLSRCCSEQGESCRSQTSPKTQHLSVYQELSGEMALIRAVGNLSSREEDLCATAALAGQEEQSPLPGLCPTPCLQRAHGPFILIPVPGHRALVSLGDTALWHEPIYWKTSASPCSCSHRPPLTPALRERPRAAALSLRAAPTATGTAESLQSCAVPQPSPAATGTWNPICCQ